MVSPPPSESCFVVGIDKESEMNDETRKRETEDCGNFVLTIVRLP
jgi:hypothetical protein